MDTLVPVLIPTLIPSPLATTTTTTISPSFIDDSDQLTSITTLGSTTTSSSTLVDIKDNYVDYYQTAAYIESMSDEELANLTNEIDNIIVDNQKEKVYIKAKK